METGIDEPQSFQAYLQNLTTRDKGLHEIVQLFVDDEELEELLWSQYKLVDCSDGGVTYGLGSFGWDIAS
jgi:hypothetical protein